MINIINLQQKFVSALLNDGKINMRKIFLIKIIRNIINYG
jgi:hypothetical protein